MQKNPLYKILGVLLVSVLASHAVAAQDKAVVKKVAGAGKAADVTKAGSADADGAGLTYTDCPGCWNPDSLGNHRVEVRFSGQGNVAKVRIPWRRRDADAEKKRIIVQDGRTGALINNMITGVVNREYGDVFFQPVSGAGTYYIYYMPYRNEGRSNYPKGVYLRADTTASSDWLRDQAAVRTDNAVAVGIQSIDAFSSFYPMEVIATSREMTALLGRNKEKTFLIFPEDRMHVIRMRDDLPYRWVRQGPGLRFRGAADRGENYTYQLGLYALQDLHDIRVKFSDLKDGKGHSIPAANAFCINTGGVSYDAKPFAKTVDLAKGQVQAMWCGVDIPTGIPAGVYTGTAKVSTGGVEQTVAISIAVSGVLSAEGGVNEPYKMTRLKWLNSTLAQQNDVIAPYTPLEVRGDTIGLLGRRLWLNQQGFPEQIQTYFTPEMTGYTETPNTLLGENIHFHFTRLADGKDIKLKSDGLIYDLKEKGTMKWHARSMSEELQMDVSATLEFDGFLSYTVKVTALQDLDMKEITMHIPMRPESAKYMMGLGQKGGDRPDSMYRWKWDVAHKNQDGAWLGNVNIGLQYSLRDERYSRPLNTNFYLQKPLLLPSSWGNEGKGGINVGMKGKNLLVDNYSGVRHLRKGDTLYYNFNLLITPFHPINTDFQWATRFYHRYNNLDSIRETGATVVNIHHATPINPWINYPFIEWRHMKAYIDTAHHLGLKVKIYNTVRELSDHAYETFALRSLGHEVYSPGPGGGYSWLQEHLGSDYIAAWFVPEIKDAAIINSGMNRWHNYYVEGMNWLVQHVGIDGIYLDDVAFDRVTMKRIKRVLTRDGHPGIIDLHSANQYNKHDGFNNSGNLYMEHFPYLNRLWFGEYFDYEKNAPDFFLVEVSGIPFGLMGEMLQDGGNPWRGMVYGMTNRMPWTENADPRPIWKVWDEFGIQGTKMVGYWSPNCPVRTSNGKILATVYQKSGAALVSMASWADQDTTVSLQIDWAKLGIDPAKARIVAPEVKDFQPARTFLPGEAIPVQKGKGWLLEIRQGS